MYDAIVIGAGGVGSAALYHLAARGAKAVGLDRFPIAHDRGSSHGQTRIIRQAYFEHPDYVPLLMRAYELWAQLAANRGVELLRQTGLLQIGPPEGTVLPGVLRSAEQHGLALEKLTAHDIESRFPGFRVPNGCEGVLEPAGGVLKVEVCVRAHAEEAMRLGAELRIGPAVRAWRAEQDFVTVTTDDGVLQGRRLIVTAGPWAGELLADLGLRLQVLRKHQYWYEAGPAYQAQRCPAFLFELPEGIFYGIPQMDERGIKLAEHTGGQAVHDPLQIDRQIDEADRGRVEDFASRCLPEVSRRLVGHSVCMYTMSPDENFILDRHPQHPQVLFAAGLSGHGFKFTCVLGQALAELALEGGTELPIGFLRSDRPGLHAVNRPSVGEGSHAKPQRRKEEKREEGRR